MRALSSVPRARAAAVHADTPARRHSHSLHTMSANKYQKPLTITAALPAVLKDFTREVLRAQVGLCRASLRRTS